MTHALLHLWRGTLMVLGAITSLVAHAQTESYPSKTITIVVPYTAGGTTDLLARSVADVLHKATGQAVVVENRPGAGGAIAGKQVIRSAPDGYTLMMTSSGINSVTPVVYKDFNVLEGLAQVSVLVEVPFAFTVNKKFPAQTMRDFIQFAKQRPDTVSVGNASRGSHGHLTHMLFEKAAGVQLNSVAYKGSTPSINDLLGGHVDAVVDNAGVLKPFIDSDKMTALFVTSKTRSPALPQVPTAIELGLPFDSVAWFGLAAPRNTPAPIVTLIRNLIAKGFEDKESRARLVQAGLVPVFGTPADATARTLAETQTLGKLAATLNLSQD